jgi:hypothetical protein
MKIRDEGFGMKRKIFNVLYALVLVLSLGLTVATQTATPVLAAPALTYIGDIGNATSKTSGTSLVITTTAAVSAGDDIIVAFASDSSTGAVSVADSAGNSYTSAADINNPSGVRTVIFVAYHVNALPSGSTITITHPSVTARAAVASVFRGLLSAGLDRTHTGTGSSTSPSSGATSATSQADELLIGGVGTEGPSGDAAGTWGGSFSDLQRVGTTGGTATTNICVSMGYRIVSSTGTYTASKSSITSRDWATAIATFRMDNAAPTVTINQAAGQSDPIATCSGQPINFTVVFSERVVGFATGDVTLSGTAGATTTTVTETAPNDGTTYNVAVSGWIGLGTVIATIGAGKATDVAGNDNTASSSTDNTVSVALSGGSTASGSSFASVSYSGADYSWSGSGNAASSDDVYATTTLSSSSGESYYLEATGFNFSIPAGSTINGIEVAIERHQTASGGDVYDNRVRIVKVGTVGTTDKAVGTYWPTSDGTATYGNSNDLWGETWTVADINDANTGVVLSVRRTGGGSDTAYVDYISMTVYYSCPSNQAPTITTQPSNQTITYGNNAAFTAAASGSPTPTVQWQVSTGGGFSNITDGGVYSGATTNTLNLTQPPVSYSGYQYHAVYTNIAGSANTNPANLTVAKASQTITVTIHAPASAAYGDTFNVTATASSGLPVAITTDGSVCTGGGSDSATITMASGTGTGHVYYNQAGDGNYSAASQVTDDVNAQKASQTITVTTHAPANAAYGDTFNVTATASSGLTVAITTDGVVCTGGGSNSATITMASGTGTGHVYYNQAGDGNYSAASQVTENVTAGKASQTITVTIHAPASAASGDTFNVTATASSGLPVAITTDGSVCTGGGSGSATITMASGTGTGYVYYDQAGDGNYSAASQVTDDVNAQKASQTITVTIHAPASAAYGDTFNVTATAISGLPVAITTDGSVCTGGGSNSATITMASGTGTGHVYYNQAGDANYSAAAQVTDDVSAGKASQTITVTAHAPASAAYGDTFNVTATASFGLTVVITTDGVICTGGGSNSATITMASGTGTGHVYYDQAGDGNYNAASQVTDDVNAQKASQTITVTAHAPASAAYGDTFNVTATASSGLPVVITTDGSVCTGGGSNSATITMASGTGTGHVYYNQAGDANYSAASQVTDDVTVTALTYNVTGTILEGGTPLAGVLVTGVVHSPWTGTAITDADGKYVLTGVPYEENHILIITPTLAGHTFDPPNITINMTSPPTAPIENQDFAVPIAVQCDYDGIAPTTYAKIPFAIVQSGFHLVGQILDAAGSSLGLPAWITPTLVDDIGSWVGGPLSWSVDMLAWGLGLVGTVLDSLASTLGLPDWLAPTVNTIACQLFAPFSCNVTGAAFTPCG